MNYEHNHPEEQRATHQVQNPETNSPPGDAYLAYFLHIRDPEIAIQDIDQDFNNSYYGTFDTLTDFIDEQLENSGFLPPVKELRTTYSTPPDLIEHIRDYFLNAIKDTYDCYEQGGSIHVFTK